MISRPVKTAAVALTAIALVAPLAAVAQFADDSLDALVDAREIPVTVDNFIRAATDIEFGKYVALAGGVNKFYHFRDLMPVDAQTTISANRDTLYSTAIIDISEGATFTLPDVGDRYMSAMVINQDHYLNEVFHGGGTYTLDMETFDTRLCRRLPARAAGCDRPRGPGRRARDPGPDVHRGRLVRTLHRPAL
jgi:hypothetical protein